jgi:hypothetical protein
MKRKYRNVWLKSILVASALSRPHYTATINTQTKEASHRTTHKIELYPHTHVLSEGHIAQNNDACPSLEEDFDLVRMHVSLSVLRPRVTAISNGVDHIKKRVLLLDVE